VFAVPRRLAVPNQQQASGRRSGRKRCAFAGFGRGRS
jgi:hypothetical protein